MLHFILESAEHNGVTAAFAMPLTPKILGVAYDQRQIKMRSGRATIRDVEVLNSFQVFQCIKSIYSAFPLEKKMPEYYRGSFLKIVIRKKVEGL